MARTMAFSLDMGTLLSQLGIIDVPVGLAGGQQLLMGPAGGRPALVQHQNTVSPAD